MKIRRAIEFFLMSTFSSFFCAEESYSATIYFWGDVYTRIFNWTQLSTGVSAYLHGGTNCPNPPDTNGGGQGGYNPVNSVQNYDTKVQHPGSPPACGDKSYPNIPSQSAWNLTSNADVSTEVGQVYASADGTGSDFSTTAPRLYGIYFFVTDPGQSRDPFFQFQTQQFSIYLEGSDNNGGVISVAEMVTGAYDASYPTHNSWLTSGANCSNPDVVNNNVSTPSSAITYPYCEANFIANSPLLNTSWVSGNNMAAAANGNPDSFLPSSLGFSNGPYGTYGGYGYGSIGAQLLWPPTSNENNAFSAQLGNFYGVVNFYTYVTPEQNSSNSPSSSSGNVSAYYYGIVCENISGVANTCPWFGVASGARPEPPGASS